VTGQVDGNRTAGPRLLLCLALLAALLTGLALGQADGVTLERRVFEIARQLRCPVCVSESVAASSSQIALTMKQEIQDLVLAGRSDAEILDHFSSAYGDWIRLEPPKRGVHLLVWLLPGVVALAGVIMLAGFVRRWTRAGSVTPQVDEAGLKRVQEELERK
jgi:cytochrome c-type biogenesis protein CcmH